MVPPMMRSLPYLVVIAAASASLSACQTNDIEEAGMVNSCEGWYDKRQGIDGVDYLKSVAYGGEPSFGDPGTYTVELKNSRGDTIGHCTVEAPEDSDSYFVSAG